MEYLGKNFDEKREMMERMIGIKKIRCVRSITCMTNTYRDEYIHKKLLNYKKKLEKKISQKDYKYKKK
jgi:hypothetical protein